MANQSKQPDAFFEHFSKEDKPTGMGMRLVEALARKIFRYAAIKSGDSVLEIGPGRGTFADMCLKEDAEYHAIEANREMAEALRKKGANVVSAMVPPLPALDREFDIVVMVNVMEHMSTMKDALQITQDIRGALKPNGRFVVCSPDYLNWRTNFFNCDFSHNYVTTRRRLEQLLLNAGFGNIKSCHLCGPITGILCLLITAFVSRLPFGLLNALLPRNRFFYKLYKVQLTFLRKVLISGERPA